MARRVSNLVVLLVALCWCRGAAAQEGGGAAENRLGVDRLIHADLGLVGRVNQPQDPGTGSSGEPNPLSWQLGYDQYLGAQKRFALSVQAGWFPEAGDAAYPPEMRVGAQTLDVMVKGRLLERRWIRWWVGIGVGLMFWQTKFAQTHLGGPEEEDGVAFVAPFVHGLKIPGGSGIDVKVHRRVLLRAAFHYGQPSIELSQGGSVEPAGIFRLELGVGIAL